jgi:hypothetical protein
MTLTPDQVKWLEAMDITDYSVDDEGFVNVYGNVDISDKDLISIPVKFGYVSGDFYCHFNKLTSLQGSPREVGGRFSCGFTAIKTLQGAPTEIGGGFFCSSNKLTSLQGGPKEVGGRFDCNNNTLTSLQGAPREVGGDFNCNNNNFKSEPDHSFIKIGGRFVWE